MNEERPLLVSVAHAATLLGLSDRSVEYAIAGGSLDAVRLGRRVMIRRESIERLAREGGALSSPRHYSEAVAQPA